MKSNVKFLVLMLTGILLCVNNVWGTTTSVTLSDGSSKDNVNTWSISNVITITQAAGTTPSGKSQTSPSSSYISAPRWYMYNDITFKPASGITISSITVTATTTGYADALAGSSTMAVREVESSSENFNVIITPTNGSSAFTITMGGQCRLNAISVTTGAGSTYTEVYVKIALGRFNSDSICISFHPAIHSLDYPYKNSKL